MVWTQEPMAKLWTPYHVFLVKVPKLFQIILNKMWQAIVKSS